MAVGQVVPGVVRAEMKYQIPDNTCENVFHVARGLTFWTESEMDALEVVLHNWFTGTASADLSDQLGLYEILLTDLTSLHGIRKTYAISPAALGGLSGEYLPGNVTFAIKASTAIRGRGTNGRVYWPALTAPQVVNQQMNSGSATSIVNDLNALRVAVAGLGGGTELVVPHFVVGGIRPPSVGYDAVVNYAYSDLWLDAQRDRLPFHKKHKKKRTP